MSMNTHSPFFAPVLHPTLEAGLEALVVAALAWLSKHGAAMAAGQPKGQP
jgi:hippurate hydrolase